ncbi:MAG: hypothetical protein GXY71_07230 [Treponema sp.]|nr:hypothetical protein [Treponema sp.]
MRITTMQSDAHVHLPALSERQADFFLNLPDSDWRAAFVSHDPAEFETSSALAKFFPGCIQGFGIHPQSLREEGRSFLASLVEERRIGFIGEAGFEFFGDRPEWIRNEENLKSQRDFFEFQLALAIDAGLPLLVHMRKATDVLLGYAPRLRQLPSLIFHGWPGRIHDANAFLLKGVNAFFSFGTPLLRQAAHALECCRALPGERILSETDAPWQPPRGWSWTRLDHIIPISRLIASARGLEAEEMGLLLRKNFNKAFGLED